MYNTVVRLCQFFCCGRKVNFVQIPYGHDRFSKISRTFFVKKWSHIKPTYKKIRVRTWNPVYGNSHSGKTWISVSGHETRSTGQIDVLIIWFLREIECIEFECNEFLLVLVLIDLIHFELSICISSTWIKTNTNPLVQLQLKLIHIRYM